MPTYIRENKRQQYQAQRSLQQQPQQYWEHCTSGDFGAAAAAAAAAAGAAAAAVAAAAAAAAAAADVGLRDSS